MHAILGPGLGRLRIALCATMLLLACGCTYYQPAPGVYTPTSASTFDRSWNAALGAAADEGVHVTTQDRTNGVIRGTKGQFNVDMSVRTQADGNVRVEINAQGPQGQDPTLADRLSQAYDRRMGR
jgi:hypothetical protein